MPLLETDGGLWPAIDQLHLTEPEPQVGVEAYQHLDMGVITVDLQEQSEREGRMVDLGTLSDDTDPSIWQGKASLAARIERGEITEARVGDHLAKLPRHYVPVTKGAPRRCVDDRGVAGFDPANPESYVLGPQFQGGTIEDAYTTRLGEITKARKAGQPVEVGCTIADDVAVAMERPSMFAPGDHTDDHHSPDATGCGLADTMPVKNARIAAEPALVDAATTKTDAVLALDGRRAPEGVYRDMAASAGELAKHPGYFATMQRAFELIQQRSLQGMPLLTGPHLPGSVTLNFVRGTTFNTSGYAADTNGELYNFGFDAWAVIDEYPSEQAATIIADAVITLSQLTDGSPRLLARLPQETQAA